MRRRGRDYLRRVSSLIPCRRTQQTGEMPVFDRWLRSARWSQLLVLLLLAGVAAATAACGEIQNSDLVQLSTAELEALLPGSAISNVVSVEDDGSWEFGCDGLWRSFGGRGGQASRYTIGDGRYCLKLPSGPACYRVLRGRDGAMFMQKEGFDPAEVRPIQPIRIRSMNSKQSCK